MCDDAGLNFATRLVMEREANEFAADLLFLKTDFASMPTPDNAARS